MELKMCTNCGQIHRPEEHQSVSKHAHIRKQTERCDVPGRAGKSCSWRKHLAKQTKASQGKCLFRCPRQHSFASPERGSRKQAWGEAMDSHSIRREGGWQGNNGGPTMKVEGQTGEWEETWAAGEGGGAARRKLNRKRGQKAQKKGIMAGQRMASAALKR